MVFCYSSLSRLKCQWLLRKYEKGKKRKLLTGTEYWTILIISYESCHLLNKLWSLKFFMDSSRGESTTLLDTPLGDYLAFSTLHKAFRCMIMFNVYLPPEAQSLLPRQVSASFICQLLLLFSIWPKYSCIPLRVFSFLLWPKCFDSQFWF